MEVTFTRTHERRYRVTAARDLGATVVIDPAPGYDESLPHDLVHFVVEAACGIEYGIFGVSPPGESRTSGRRVEHAESRPGGRSGCATSGRTTSRSERMAGEAWSAWKASAAGRPDVSVSPEIAGVLSKLDEAAAAWRSVAVGHSMTLAWPRPEHRVTRGAKHCVKHPQRSPR